ncbi:hypothetical protein WICMUC_000443 [Wickerhamomyces mucosus]|uniref:DUF7702 domain-containing protein n=1 Tax=Wickerhamomyces mucosus TaxID=1378264 RepID=A0A9P8PZ69_9ASCO|nr:hypothetical protein WICMUC_000443 [Wickerhamomyces mucosus]
MFGAWNIISIVEITFYALVILLGIYPTIKIISKKSRFGWFYIRYGILVFSKLVAGALLVGYIHQLNDYINGNEIENINGNEIENININLLIASLVLNSISLGFLNMLNNFIVAYVDKFGKIKEEQNKKKYPGQGIIYLIFPIESLKEFYRGKIFDGFESLSSKLTLYAIIINSVGSSRVEDTDSNERKVTKQIMEAGAIIYLISILSNGILTCIKIFHQKSIHFKKILGLSLTIFPFLLIRIIYNVCAAFTYSVDGTFSENVSKFTFLLGDWKLYLGLLFVEECICTAILLVITWIVLYEEPSQSSYTVENEKEYDESYNSV